MEQLTERQIATLLASLRLRQAELQCDATSTLNTSAYITAAELDQIATNAGEFNALTVDEIDALCDRLSAQRQGAKDEIEYREDDIQGALQEAVDYLADAFEESSDSEALLEWLSGWRQRAKRALSYQDVDLLAPAEDAAA